MNNTRTVQRLCAVLELGTLWQWVCCLSLPLFLVFTETPTAATCFWAAALLSIGVAASAAVERVNS